MLRYIVGIFFLLHGLVHLLYFGQSWRLFELQEGMVWPDGSWAFSGLLGDKAARWLASLACVVSAAGFVASGFGLSFGQAWWRTTIVYAAVFSSLVFILFWNGTMQKLDNQGGAGLLINLAILVALASMQKLSLNF
jgi:hypothetical protein